jgi:hypothetical protein
VILGRRLIGEDAAHLLLVRDTEHREASADPGRIRLALAPRA